MVFNCEFIFICLHVFVLIYGVVNKFKSGPFEVSLLHIKFK